MNEMKCGRLAVFQGITPNVGTSVIAFGTAWLLAQHCNPDLRVAFVCLHLKSSKLHHYCGIDQPIHSLDRIRADLRTNSLNADALRSQCHHFQGKPHLSVLFGNLLREQAEYFTEQDIQNLLTLCRKAFDITIIETGAYWDNAAVFTAMREADERFFVGTNRLHSFQEDFRRSSKPMLDAMAIQQQDCGMILSRYRKGDGYGKQDVRKQTGMDIIATVRDDSIVETLVDQGRLTELYEGPYPINRDLQFIYEALQRKWGMHWKRCDHDDEQVIGQKRHWYHKLRVLTGR